MTKEMQDHPLGRDPRSPHRQHCSKLDAITTNSVATPQAPPREGDRGAHAWSRTALARKTLGERGNRARGLVRRAPAVRRSLIWGGEDIVCPLQGESSPVGRWRRLREVSRSRAERSRGLASSIAEGCRGTQQVARVATELLSHAGRAKFMGTWSDDARCGQLLGPARSRSQVRSSRISESEGFGGRVERIDCPRTRRGDRASNVLLGTSEAISRCSRRRTNDRGSRLWTPDFSVWPVTLHGGSAAGDETDPGPGDPKPVTTRELKR